MTSPAERFAAARKRNEEAQTPLSRFRSKYPFDLDGFQLEACEALADGRGVLVAAPTGSGKTVVGEFAVYLALEAGRKAFYTTPIKALSNQKYADLARMHGAENVGLLTGDTSINADAPVVVMTTEVLRNMLYADSDALNGLAYVVMDEVHYLADRFRGAVWEEVIIHLPDDVLLVSLSATVSNAEEFGAWLDTVRGNTEVVVSEDRPVPLWQHVMANRQLYDLFAEGTTGDGVNPELLQITRDANRRERQMQGSGGRRGGTTAARGSKSRGTYARGGSRRTGATPSRTEVINALDSAGLLPAITFIFSRAGCDAAVQQCLYSGIRLTSPEERTEIRHIVESRTADIPDEDLSVLGYYEWAEALSRGVAAHHAGLLPAFKQVVEELFTRGLVKAVFATETLALGINMPARSVVLEKLVKWNGETHADVTPGEYTQLTGRAGRRGIDVEGHAVVLWQPGLDPEVVGGLASTRTFPLRSSFRPTYNMAVNLVGQVGRARAREILETSFAQFQADRAVVGLAKQARKQEEALEGYAGAMDCHLGDFREYAGLRRKIGERETQLSRTASRDRRSEVIGSLEKLRRGDVIRVPGGRKPGWAVVLDPGVAGGDSLEGPRPSILTIERQVRRLSLLDVPTPVEAATRVTVPKNFNGRDATNRRDLASSVRNALGSLEHHPEDFARNRPKGKKAAAHEDEELNRLRRQMRSHPCHGCAEREDHARWAERYFRLKRETDALVRRIEGRTNTIARVFDRVCDLLTERGYLAGDKVTPAGEQLRRIYSESDLLVSECLRGGVWKELDVPGLTAVVSAVVYESRRDEKGLSPRIPKGAPVLALDTMTRIWSVLDDEERAHKLDVTPEPDLGLAWAIHRWASGQPLQAVLRDADLAAGDFVRWCKQVIDLLGQIAQASDDPALVRTARAAVDAISRGVVAAGPARA
ncbi:DEAD/DEAH box helicase [Kineosporia succinea]|uniref:ATP-dependent RNA helicase HelY n=1 Tax=Kineosporia succinea TaxID=84632 RepID=A0ABT9P7R5_9ACTN|nr:DEAD/DEAH box helicase [Kineosporia succinea]MDP9828746.1 ATP-dependent RNA helicase HelY [Kineosporia succinea]